MEAREFRHGNFINTPIGIQKIIDVLCDSVNTENYEALPYECIAPIKLTEEILLKCGFKRSITGNFEITDFVFSLCNNTICSIVSSNFKPTIKYLHQLQNLYFALTNEELEINL